MIEHIEAMCKVWGGQRQAIDFGISQGHAKQSTTEKAREFRLSDKAPAWFRKKPFTATGMQDFVIRPTQFTEEGHTGDGLVIAKSLKGAPEDLRKLSYARYVIMLVVSEGSVHQYKADHLGITLTEYWRLIDRLHHFILGRLPLSEEGYLTVGTGKRILPDIPARVAEVSPVKPELDFAVYQRQRLKVWR